MARKTVKIRRIVVNFMELSDGNKQVQILGISEQFEKLRNGSKHRKNLWDRGTVNGTER